jgi:NAD(P)-dependent dehydrogenase (short-subunit alcohol dehydrogenase family)
VDIDDRIAVVTGGAKGIGFAIAKAFIEAGAAGVAIADLTDELVDAAVEQLGPKAIGLAVDVSSRAAVAGLVETVEGRLGPIDVFVSNAGIGSGAGVEASDEAWDAIWKVNVLAHVYAAEAVLPSMLARGEGYLVSTASAAGLLSQIGDLPYSATKHAAVAVAEWLAITYGAQGIKVSCLCPQGVRTDLIAHALGHASVETVVAQGLLEPEDVAAAVVESLAKEEFLILPHPEVAEYYRRRATDTDRWLAGMAKLQARILGSLPEG